LFVAIHCVCRLGLDDSDTSKARLPGSEHGPLKLCVWETSAPIAGQPLGPRGILRLQVAHVMTGTINPVLRQPLKRRLSREVKSARVAHEDASSVSGKSQAFIERNELLRSPGDAHLECLWSTWLNGCPVRGFRSLNKILSRYRGRPPNEFRHGRPRLVQVIQAP